MSVHVILPSDCKDTQREDIKSGIFKVLKPLKYKGLRIDYYFEQSPFKSEYDILILALPENKFARTFNQLSFNQNQYIGFCRANNIPILILYKTISDGYRLYKTDLGAGGISGTTLGRDDIKHEFEKRYLRSLEPEPEPKPEEEAMPMLYRFKTEEEFKEEGLWNESLGVPCRWNSDKKMNHLLGASIEPRFNKDCEEKKSFSLKEDKYSWTIQHNEYKRINKDIEVQKTNPEAEELLEKWRKEPVIFEPSRILPTHKFDITQGNYMTACDKPKSSRTPFDHDAINKRIHELKYHHGVDRRVLI